jgi:hypothetical protein
MLTPTELLELWFRARVGLINGSKRHQIKNIGVQLSINDAYIKIVDYRDEVISIITKNSRLEGTRILSERFELSISQATHLINSRLHILSMDSPDILKQTRDSLKVQLDNAIASLSTIPDEIAKKALQIKRTHGTQRVSIIPKYVGCVSLPTLNGSIQFSDVNDIPLISQAFQKSDLNITHYQNHSRQFIIGNKPDEGAPYKHVIGTIASIPNRKTLYTTFIGNDGYACCVKDVYSAVTPDGSTFYTGEQAIALYKDGSVKVVRVPDVLSVRKTMSKGSSTDIIHLYPYTDKPHYIVISSKATLNSIWVWKVHVTPDRPDKIILIVGAPVNVQMSDRPFDWYFTLTDDVIHRTSARIFQITDCDALLEGKNSIIVDLSTNKFKRHPYFKQLP